MRRCRGAKGRFRKCGSGGARGRAKSCRFGVNKRTGRCLKRRRK